MTRIHTSVAVLVAALVLGCRAQGRAGSPLRVAVTFPSTLHADPITGRVFVLITRDSGPEPRVLAGGFGTNVAMYGVDVSALKPGKAGVVSDTKPGFPHATLRDIPAGDYWVQAVLNVYSEFHRADGHTIWAHMDQWEGQHLTRSPGNLYSPVTKVHLDPASGFEVALQASQVIPPVVVPPDTKWVKRIKIQSDILTKFWGHPMFLGATVLLPQGYDEHPNVHYPVLYEQGHFTLAAPMGFTTDSLPAPTEAQLARTREYNVEPGDAFYHEWTSAGFPRMFVITFQHPTPYFDDSYAVN